MRISNRRDLIDFCLRKLGASVVKINVADEQITDRIDEAFRYWQEFNMDAIRKGYWTKKVTQEDVTRGYFIMPDNLVSLNRIVSIGGSVMEQQIMMDIMSAPSDVVLHEQYIKFKHADEATNLLSLKPSYELTRNTNQLYIRHALRELLDKTLVMTADFFISEEEATKLYSDYWFIRYCTALIKQQWAQNLKKFSGINMIGGVTFDAEAMWSEALEEINKLEDEMRSTFMDPTGFILVG